MTNADRIALQTLLDSPHHQERLAAVADAIRNGAVFVYPTETIYGIGGACTIPGVREKILSAKQRQLENPMILLAPDLKFFAQLRLCFSPAAQRLATLFWPDGLLTMVLPSADEPYGVGIRITSHPFLQALFRHIDTPLYSTSANLSGEAYVNDPDRIFSDFRQSADFMVDAGPLPPSPPSTVVRIERDNTVAILREGAVSAELIRKASGQ